MAAVGQVGRPGNLRRIANPLLAINRAAVAGSPASRPGANRLRYAEE